MAVLGKALKFRKAFRCSVYKLTAQSCPPTAVPKFIFQQHSITCSIAKWQVVLAPWQQLPRIPQPERGIIWSRLGAGRRSNGMERGKIRVGIRPTRKCVREGRWISLAVVPIRPLLIPYTDTDTH